MLSLHPPPGEALKGGGKGGGKGGAKGGGKGGGAKGGGGGGKSGEAEGGYCAIYGVLRTAHAVGEQLEPTPRPMISYLDPISPRAPLPWKQVSALDATLVSPLAVLLFGGQSGEGGLRLGGESGGGEGGGEAGEGGEGGERGGGGAAAEASGGGVLATVGGEQFELSAADAALVGPLRAAIARAVASGGEQAGEGEVGSGGLNELRALLRSVLKGMDAPWAGLPAGWAYEEDGGGKARRATRLEPPAPDQPQRQGRQLLCGPRPSTPHIAAGGGAVPSARRP